MNAFDNSRYSNIKQELRLQYPAMEEAEKFPCLVFSCMSTVYMTVKGRRGEW